MPTREGGCRLWFGQARDRIISACQRSRGSVTTPLFHTGDPRSNRLLASLPELEWSRWSPAFERVVLPMAQVLCTPGVTPTHLYFPTTAVVSLLHATRDGASAEIAVVGHEGMLGISLFMGGHFMSGEAVVQGAGQGYRISAQAAMKEFHLGGLVMNVLLRYTQAVIEQVARTAACNRHHTIEQQLCRRLLLGLDRSASPELLMTQEALSRLLGVRREGVTQAALKLQHAGAIRYRRGRIDVLDRRQLEHGACECYAAAHADHAKPAARMAMA
jgi:CRP-like cAMP-binding protein